MLDSVLQLDEAVEHGLRARRATRNVKIDRHNAIDTLQDGVIVVGPTRTRTGSEGNDPVRLGDLVINAPKDRCVISGEIRAPTLNQASAACSPSGSRGPPLNVGEFAEVLVVFFVTAFTLVDLSDVGHELDRSDPLDHFEPELALDP